MAWLVSAAPFRSSKLTAPDAGEGTSFGWAVVVAGDLVAIGAVYLHHRNQGDQNLWGLVKKIIVSNSTSGDYFITSLSTNDLFLLVGADWKNLAGAASGAAHLFQWDMGGTDNWGLVSRFQPGEPAAQDQFGFSASLSGDTILVGAVMKDIGGPEAARLMSSRSTGLYFYHRSCVSNFKPVGFRLPATLDRDCLNRQFLIF